MLYSEIAREYEGTIPLLPLEKSIGCFEASLQAVKIHTARGGFSEMMRAQCLAFVRGLKRAFAERPTFRMGSLRGRVTAAHNAAVMQCGGGPVRDLFGGY
mmetsp:Transcript_22671/g.69251  ORF Transcript_22671/g.69251 Transcript_22671/m.69251 type:complete len:100 (-) Transcript_22671:163-462(-)|eukprot:scaffold60270_cov41-Tisochrysis_lutea.AAC.4